MSTFGCSLDFGYQLASTIVIDRNGTVESTMACKHAELVFIGDLLLRSSLVRGNVI
jgi:hypothetical protein